MLPLSLLRTAQGNSILLELRSGVTFNGELVNCDQYMNINLKNVVCTSRDGSKFLSMDECYVKGHTVKYLRVPDQVIDMVQQADTAFRGGRGRGFRGGRGDRGGRGGRGGYGAADRGGRGGRGRGARGGAPGEGRGRGGYSDRGGRGGYGSADRGGRGGYVPRGRGGYSSRGGERGAPR